MTLDWSLLDNANIVADAHGTAGHEYHYYSHTLCACRQTVPLENWWLRPCIEVVRYWEGPFIAGPLYLS